MKARFHPRRNLVLQLGLSLLLTTALGAQNQPKTSKLDDDARHARDISIAALDEIKRTLEEYYYDPKYHNIDLKARIEAAKERVKTLQYNWQMYRVLAQLLLDLDDSHTFLLMPPRPDHYDFGFGMQMIGDDCFVTYVEKDGAAHEAGLDIGDQVLMIRNLAPSRADLWKMIYVIYLLDPVNTLELQVKKPDGTEKKVKLKAVTMSDKEFRERLKQKSGKKKLEPYRCEELGTSVIACKLFSFDVGPDVIDKMMRQVSKYPKFVLDLRGNSGGFSETENRLLSYFFDHEVKIADLIRRKKSVVEKTKVLGDKTYRGDVSVLIDSESASAAEVTARVLQIEKRAKIYGDISDGAVMGSYRIPFDALVEKFIYTLGLVSLGMSVTVEDVIMSDGSRIEKQGVIPDVVLQPTGAGLKQRTDPVLAVAAYKFGIEMTPEKAGAFKFMVPEEYQLEELFSPTGGD